MLFTTLAGLVSTSDKVVMTLSMKNGQMSVIILPSAKDGIDPALKQPLVLSSTPEELDQGFPEAIASYSGIRRTLVEQIEATATILKNATAAQSKKAATALAKPSKGGKPAVTDTDKEEIDTPEPHGAAPSAPEDATSTAAGTDLFSLFGKE